MTELDEKETSLPVASGVSEQKEPEIPPLERDNVDGEHDKSTKLLEIPMVGMKFKSEDDIRTFYREYAYSAGFGIRKKSARVRGNLRYFSLVCCRQGKHLSKTSNPTRATTRINCKAKVNVKVGKNGVFEISNVELNHNHDLSPGKAHRFRCYKQVDIHGREKLELNDETEIKLPKNVNALVTKVNGVDDMTFGHSELKLGEGDASALQEYFNRMQAKDEKFYYTMDLSEEGRLRNVFWADARSRAAYESFGDIITFDSTYVTNKYDMPFASFVGVNHHGHSILLGCALLSNEDTNTYIWLFKCWLECMSGRAPLGIITEQCEAIRLAISAVFPNTFHRLCLWHIMKKMPEKFGSYADYLSIKRTFKHLVYESLKPIEFEKKWFEMVEEYELQSNSWLGTLYSQRTMWVPVYLKKYFWAGMSTTQRNENMNAFFDGYVHPKTSLRQFFREYDSALRYKVEKENHADFISFSTSLPLVSDLHIEKQLHGLYTHEIFKKVQGELKGLFYCNASLVREDGPISTFEVTDSILAKDGESRKEITYDIEFNGRENTIDCLCGLYQFKGIICRHIIATMIKKNCNKIPEKYILSRWRKDIKRRHTLIKSSYDDFDSNPSMQMYDDLMKSWSTVAEEGIRSVEKYKILKDHILEGKEKLRMVDCSFGLDKISENPNKVVYGDTLNNNKRLISPPRQCKRGRPPTIRTENFTKRKNKPAEFNSDIHPTNDANVEVGNSQMGENHHPNSSVCDSNVTDKPPNGNKLLPEPSDGMWSTSFIAGSQNGNRLTQNEQVS